MIRRITLKNQDEFEAMIENQDEGISNAIVEVALANLDTDKRYVPVLEVILEDEEVDYDISLDTNNIVETLEQNLEIQELHENYETCSLIKKALDKLKSK